jgi:hypothetical protein
MKMDADHSEGLCLRAYLDESGTHAGSPIVTLAGYVSTEDRWQRFTAEWSAILHRFGANEFKTADWFSKKGEFNGWSDEIRYRLWHALARVIDKRVRFAVSVSVPVRDHERLTKPKLRKDSAFTDAYCFGMQACVEIITTETRRRRERVEFVFDGGHHRQGLSARWFAEMVRRRQWIEWVSPVFGHASSVECQALQAADAIAWTTRKHLDDLLRDPAAKPRPELIRLRRSVTILGGRLDMVALMRDVDAKVARALKEAEDPGAAR